MRTSRINLNTILLAGMVLVALGVNDLHAQTAGLGVHPGRMEMTLQPGQEKTIAYEIESPASEVPVRGRLLLSLTDWNLDENGAVSYLDPGATTDSASAWSAFSPSSLSIASGQKQMIRVTVRVPESTRRGLYKTAVMMQERPPAADPKPGERNVYLRFRYVFTLYVIVPPVEKAAELADVQVVNTPGKGMAVICEMQNQGTLHLRPYITWVLKDSSGHELMAARNQESRVLLPFAKLKEQFPIEDLPAGEYQVNTQVDFGDAGPIQASTRRIQVQTAEDGSIRVRPVETLTAQTRKD